MAKAPRDEPFFGDTLRGTRCFEGVFNRRAPSRTFSLSGKALSLLSLFALSSSGCILDINAAEYDDDDHHGFHSPVLSHCERERQHCLLQAGGNSMFQASCQKAYRSCLGFGSGSTQPSQSTGCPEKSDDDTGDCPGADSSQGGDSSFSYPEDAVWKDRCDRIEAGCQSACSTPQERERCQAWGKLCRSTKCGEHQRCSAKQVKPQLAQCGSGHLACLDGASDEDEQQLCADSFRVCTKAIRGFEGVGGFGEDALRECLDQNTLCRRAASSTELELNCATMLRACLRPW